MSAKVLVVSIEQSREPWNPVLARKTWNFNSADIALLEEGETLFHGDVAFYLEDDYE